VNVNILVDRTSVTINDYFNSWPTFVTYLSTQTLQWVNHP